MIIHLPDNAHDVPGLAANKKKARPFSGQRFDTRLTISLLRQLLTCFTMVSMSTFSLGVSLAHVLAGLGLAVKFCALAVIGIGL
ncbi:hypothetical protein BH11PSE12_BH11PSE12_24210 [soil metagenome]